MRAPLKRSFSLSRRNIAYAPLRSLLTASAIALGIAMLLAASILMQATTRSAHQLVVRESAIDLQLTRRDERCFAANLAESIAELPDIQQVVPILAVTAKLQGIQISLHGVELGYATPHVLRMESGAFLDRSDSLALPVEIAERFGLSLGQSMALSLDGRSVELVLTGLLPVEENASPFAASQNQVGFLPLSGAQTLAGAPGQISRLDIVMRERADINKLRIDIQALVGDEFAVVQIRPVTSFSVMDVLVQGLLGLVGVMILFASAFVIFNAFAMAIAGRRREIGALRCLGITRHQVFRNTLAEAVYLALAGMLSGIVLGIALGWAIQQIMGTLDEVPFAVPWWGLVFSPLIGLLTTLVGAFGPAWQSQLVSPLTALRSDEAPGSGADSRRRSRQGWAVLLLILLGLAGYGLAVRPDFNTGVTGLAIGIIFIIASIALVLPGLMLPLSKLFDFLSMRRLGVAGRLAVDGLSRHPGRSAATAAGLAIGPAIVIYITGVMSILFANFFTDQNSMVHEDATIGLDYTAAMQSGQLSVDNFAAYLLNQPPIDPQIVAEVEAIAAREGFDVVHYGLLRLPLGGLPPMNTVAVADLDIYTRIGNFDYFSGNRAYTLKQMSRGPVILLPPGDAGRQGVELGDKISLPTSQGEIEFIVAGIGGNNLFVPFLAYQDAQRYFDLQGPTSLGIILPVGSEKERIFAAIDALLEGEPLLALNRDMDETVDAAAGMLGAFEALLDGLMLLAVVVASLGVVNTIMINISERSRELGTLRAVGATRKQVLQSVMWEAGILGLAAAALSAGLALLLFGAFLLVATPNGYYSMGVIFQWDTLPPALGKMVVGILISLVSTPGVAALAAYLPARSAARLDVIEATRSDRLSLKALNSTRSYG